MQKQLLMMMLGIGAVGSFNAIPTPAYAIQAPAKTIKVTGQVVDQDGEPLTGATVKIQNTTNGTITDIDGNYELTVSPTDILVISYVGYKNRDVAVNGRAIIPAIQLEMEDAMLEQVVVVGYGTQKKADLTGSVSIVNADELKKSSNSNISTMLEGKVPGVQITSDGQPGADPTVRIRGIGSFNSTAPLYVIDGVPMGTSIRDFSPNDIETIQILKDAAAGAIYGSRAANGVVIITTKNGLKDQPMKVDYKGYFGADIISDKTYDVMNAEQYSQFLGQACANSGTLLPGGYSQDSNGKFHFRDNTDTDWFKEVFKTGIRQNHNLNMSGGGNNNTYNIALDYFNQKGTLEGAGPNYERYTARINNNFETKFIKFRTSLTYAHSNQDGMGLSNASEYVQGLYGDVTNVLRGTLLMQPTIKAYDPNSWCLDDVVGAASGYENDAHGFGVYYDNVHGDIAASNPLLVNKMLTRNTIVDRINGTLSANVDLLKMVGLENKNHKLSYNINLAYNKTFVTGKTWIASWIQSNRVYLDKSNEKLTLSKNTYTDALIENTVTYDGTFGDLHVNLVGGQSYEEENTHNMAAWATNLSRPLYLQLQNGASRDAESFEYKHALASYFGRLNVDYAGKYLLSAIVRRDGSSRLTKDIRFDVFPSVSLGWRLDKEDFFPIDDDIVNMAKIRASYGELGNVNIGDYANQATMARNNMSYSFGNTPIYGSAISTFVNELLAWEKKKTTNVGLDLALLNNRIEFTAEWYKNVSSDLLYSVPVPTNGGVANTTVVMNAAEMENSGLEFSATYRDQTSFGLKYEISANISTLKNKVTSLGFGTESYTTGAYRTEVGSEVGKFYGWKYQGIARTQADIDNHVNANGVQIVQENAGIGDCLYEDINNDGVIDDKDQTILGSGLPKVNFGLSAHLSYKGLDVNVSTFGVLNYHVSDDIYNSLNSCYGPGNKSVKMLNANKWNDDHTTYIASVPRTYYEAKGRQWNNMFSNRMIQDAAYWKIANVEIGYNFPNKWFNGIVSNVRVYASAQNLATITQYEGYNVDFAGGTFTPGYNFCSFPTPRTFMGGVQFSF